LKAASIVHGQQNLDNAGLDEEESQSKRRPGEKAPLSPIQSHPSSSILQEG